MNAASIPAADLASRLLDAASGIPAGTAAAGLITGHGHFLHRPDFRQVITSGATISTGRPLTGQFSIQHRYGARSDRARAGASTTDRGVARLRRAPYVADIVHRWDLDLRARSQ